MKSTLSQNRKSIKRFAAALLAIVVVPLLASFSSGVSTGKQFPLAANPKAIPAAAGGVLPAAMSGSATGPTPGNTQPPTGQLPYTVQRKPRVGQSSKNDVSPPLSSMRMLPPSKEHEEHDNPPVLLPQATPGSKIIDPVVQTSFDRSVSPGIPNPLLSFAGISYANGGAGWPPDPNGAVGYNYYVEMVNSSFAIFNKSGGLLYGPAGINTLWQGFGGICESNNNGDPIVLYDRSYDRWLISQFAIGPNSNNTPSWQCIAISSGSDPRGSYYRYAFLMSTTEFYDYPHISVWPFGYFMTANVYNGTHSGAVVAFDRNRMVQGQPSGFQVFDSITANTLPSDYDGALPPWQSPNYIVGLSGSQGLNTWRFYLDFQNFGNSHLDGPTYTPVAPFNTTLCGDSAGNCIPQPEVTYHLQGLNDRLMYRLAYRNFGDHESLVVDHTVVAPSGYPGIRWYELRNLQSYAPTVYQQGTYAISDYNYRWLGSAAQDRDGNLAIGFNVSGYYPTYPSIAYAGRLATDPLGELSQGENVIIRGTGSQTDVHDRYGRQRWGDYSSLSIDPADDCTFWYTGEYYQTTGNNWQTRIGSFKFASCGQATPTRTPSSTSTPTRTPSPTVTFTPTITPTPGCDTSITTASIGPANPTHLHYVGLTARPSNCGTTEACPGVVTDYYAYHYNAHNYANSSPNSICVTVTINPSACGPGSYGLESYAYLYSFDPNNICDNYLASYGSQIINSPASYSFTVPPFSTFAIDVEEFLAGYGCGSYTITVSGLPCEIPTDTPTATSTTTTTPTITPTSTLTPSPTLTPSSTATPPPAIINGHLTWQGIAQPNTRNVGITATLTLCVNGTPASYPVTTDQNGNFTVTAGLLPGTYNWRIKGLKSLANTGQLTFTGPPVSVEFGTQKAGDVDSTHNNVINTIDFNILKAAFGQTGSAVDLNNDVVVNTIDFNLLKGNFGQAGAPVNCP